MESFTTTKKKTTTSKAYKKLGKYKESLEMYELYIKTKDSLESEKNQKEINVLYFGTIPKDGTIEGASAIAVHVKAPNTNVAGLNKRILIENNLINGGKHALLLKGLKM